MEGLYKVEMDQNVAKEMLQTGGFLLLLDVPQGTVVGLDQQVTRCLPASNFLQCTAEHDRMPHIYTLFS